MSRPIFVAGATGVAGRAYVLALRAAGHQVRASVRPGDERDWSGGGGRAACGGLHRRA